MILIARDTNAIDQRLKIVEFATKMGYSFQPNYESSTSFIYDEANNATNWLNDYKSDGNNYYGWQGSNWGYYEIAAP